MKGPPDMHHRDLDLTAVLVNDRYATLRSRADEHRRLHHAGAVPTGRRGGTRRPAGFLLLGHLG